MKNLFVNYDTSLKLKEIGFDEYCICGYSIKTNSLTNVTTDLNYNTWSCKNSDLDDKYISAPLYQQVIDWFREKQNLLIMIKPKESYPENRYCFTNEFYINILHNDYEWNDDDVRGYYESLDRAIKESIKFIKIKK